MGIENLLGLVANVNLQKVKISWAGTYDNVKKANVPDWFQVPFNPTEYGVDQGNQIGETHIPGLESPVLQFVHGTGRTLSLQLFIDTTEPKAITMQTAEPGRQLGQQERDASRIVGLVTGLLAVRGETHAPPVCKVEWGTFQFIGVMVQAKTRYLLFNYEGTPLRATVDVVFREYRPIEVQLKEPFRSSPDKTKLRPLLQGETLSQIAYEAYGDPGQWRPIAARNRILNPLRLPAATWRFLFPELPPTRCPPYGAFPLQPPQAHPPASGPGRNT